MIEAKTVLRGHNLKVMVFANPERRNATKWNMCFRSPEHTFCPVKRMGGLQDPNDEAIQTEARRLAKCRGTQGIALLVNDRDFVESVKLLCSSGKEVVVFMPRGFHAKSSWWQQSFL